MSAVHRGIAVVAWLVATALSVGISTAAVGNVRAEVSERSSLMSLAAIRSATSTTTSTVVLAAGRQADIPSLAVVLDPTTSDPAPPSTSTSTTSIAVASTEPPAPASTTPQAPETTSRRDGDDPVEQVAVDGGVVKVGLANDSLQLIDALPQEGYRVEMGEWLDAVIEVHFVGSDHLWNVVAELEDGRIVMSERRVDRDQRARDDRSEPEDGHRGEDDRRRTGPSDRDDHERDDEPDGEPDERRRARTGGRGGDGGGHEGGSGNGGRRGDGAGNRSPGDQDPAAESTTSTPD